MPLRSMLCLLLLAVWVVGFAAAMMPKDPKGLCGLIGQAIVFGGVSALLIGFAMTPITDRRSSAKAEEDRREMASQELASARSDCGSLGAVPYGPGPFTMCSDDQGHLFARYRVMRR